MANLTYSQIYALLDPGWSDRLRDDLTAIALAESSGNPRAVSQDGKDFGLWQIRWHVWAGDKRIKEYTGGNRDALFDPATAAKCAARIWTVQGYKAWSVYNNGAYKKYRKVGLTGSEKAYENITGAGSAVTGAVSGAVSTLQGEGLASLVQDNVNKILYWLLAVVLLVVGIVVLVLSNKTVRKVASKNPIAATVT